ncbi:MAG TPA: phage/plasmid primase, P4 family [Allocoleopsis sp.]
MMEAEILEDSEGEVLEPETTKYKPTDDEIGDMLITQWAGKIRFFFGAWHEYADGVWQPYRLLDRAIWEKLKEIKYTGIRPTASKVSSIEKYLQHYLSVDDSLIDSRHEYINLKNGLFNVDTGQLEPHNLEAFMTSQLSFAYDEGADCPYFRKFLGEALVKPDGLMDFELQSLLLEAMGYSLTANTDYRVSFWLVGASGTGKSVLINVIQELAGTSHATISLDELNNNSYQLADIAGKRLVTFTEPKANSVLADDHYKRLVSQDTIMARQIFGKPFRFRPICKLWGAMNDMPRVIDRSDAIFNRVLIIPMNHTMPEEKKDLQLGEKLSRELSGIFNLALIGLKRLRKAKAFTKAGQSEQARQEYKSENDIEAAFLAECCVIEPDYKINGQVLYDAYSSWCKRNGSMAKSSVKVARDWERLGAIRIRSMKGTVYQGIRLIESA